MHPHTLGRGEPSRCKSYAVIDCLFLVTCALLAVAVAFGIFALPRKDFSEEENRALTPLPRFSVRSLWDGSFFSSLSAFCSDRIPLRSALIRAKTQMELSLGKQENSGVLFCHDGRLVARCDYSDTGLLEENLCALREFCKSSGAICVTVPRSIDVCLGALPAQMSSAERCMRLVEEYGFDSSLRQSLMELYKSGKGVYYLTDHHLDHTGAYAVYAHLSGLLGFDALEEQDLSVQVFCEDFYGSTYSRGGLVATAADTVVLYRYEGDDEYEVHCEDAGCQLCSLYDLSAVGKKDKYLVFQGGNHGVLRISAEESKPSLLIIKDSFANAVIPLLAIHFDLTVVDPRYTLAVPSPQDFDHTVVLCGIDTLATGWTRLRNFS